VLARVVLGRMPGWIVTDKLFARLPDLTLRFFAELTPPTD